MRGFFFYHIFFLLSLPSPAKYSLRLGTNYAEKHRKENMAEAERQRIFSERARNGLSYKSSPLLGSARKYQASEKSSLSESFEGPKCYGSTRNPLQPQCDVKWIGHVLEETDTLQGVAIKYGVTVRKGVGKIYILCAFPFIVKLFLRVNSLFITRNTQLMLCYASIRLCYCKFGLCKISSILEFHPRYITLILF